jgi:RimJ/RimL family protein N-acetyltransferase
MNGSTIPLLHTSRLRLRPLLPEDLDVMHETIYADPETMRYLIGGSRRSKVQTKLSLDRMRHHVLLHGFGFMAAEQRTDRRFVGLCGLKHLSLTGEVEVGYVLQKDFWGQGLATELVDTLLQYGFQTLALDRIVGVVMPGNKASARVLEKNSLHLEGIRHLYEMDLLYYATERPAPALRV